MEASGYPILGVEDGRKHSRSTFRPGGVIVWDHYFCDQRISLQSEVSYWSFVPSALRELASAA